MTRPSKRPGSPAAPAPPGAEGPLRPIELIRATVGGILMGLANLVPGISGGTMLLASGIYPRFIQAIADLTRLRPRLPTLIVLGTIAGTAVLAILLLAGVVRDLVVEHRWIMYSLFIGLTLGGIPVVWRLARPASRAVWIGAGAGFVFMVLLAFLQTGEGGGGGGAGNPVLFLVAGLAGASAMILPGVSGGYLLLVLGVYIPILSAIDAFKDAIGARDLAAAMGPAISVLIPVGIGVVAGIVVVSNLLKWCLTRFEKATLGVLLGLLIGAVAGLWPFQQITAPVLGRTVIKGQVVTEANLADIGREDYPTAFFRPTAGHVAGAVGLVAAGFLITAGVARLGKDEEA